MKKLLSLLSVLTISGTAVPTTIAASPYQKQEKLTRNKRNTNLEMLFNIENYVMIGSSLSDTYIKKFNLTEHTGIRNWSEFKNSYDYFCFGDCANNWYYSTLDNENKYNGNFKSSQLSLSSIKHKNDIVPITNLSRFNNPFDENRVSGSFLGWETWSSLSKLFYDAYYYNDNKNDLIFEIKLTVYPIKSATSWTQKWTFDFKGNAKFFKKNDDNFSEKKVTHDFNKIIPFLISGAQYSRNQTFYSYINSVENINFNIKINELKNMNKISENKISKKLLNTHETIVKNKDSITNEASTSSYSYKETNTKSVSVEDTKGISGIIKIPHLNELLTPTLNFSNTETTIDTKSKEETITAPSQKIQISPKHQKKIIYELYLEEIVKKYNSSFFVDKSSTFTVKVRTADWWTEEVTINLLDFFKTAHENNHILYSEIIEYDKNNNTLFIKNYNITESVKNSILEIKFEEETPIQI